MRTTDPCDVKSHLDVIVALTARELGMSLRTRSTVLAIAGVAVVGVLYACGARRGPSQSLITGDAASKVYVAPGSYDEFYSFLSGGYSGQVTVYGLPSGRLLKLIPVFSQFPKTATATTKRRSRCCRRRTASCPGTIRTIPSCRMTDGVPDGRWLFINAQQHAAHRAHRSHALRDRRDHPDPELRRRTRVAVHRRRTASTSSRRRDSACRSRTPTSPIDSYKQNFKGTLSFITADQPGKMDIAFQILMPGYNYDLGHAGKGPSDGWFFFTSYNSEQANTKLEENASQNDKDFIAAVNYKPRRRVRRRRARRSRRPASTTTTGWTKARASRSRRRRRA